MPKPTTIDTPLGKTRIMRQIIEPDDTRTGPPPTLIPTELDVVYVQHSHNELYVPADDDGSGQRLFGTVLRAHLLTRKLGDPPVLLSMAQGIPAAAVDRAVLVAELERMLVGQLIAEADGLKE